MSEELRQGILVLDYGSKYTLQVARKIRDQGTYCEVWPCNDPRVNACIAAKEAPAKALILSGGYEVLDLENPPKLKGGLLDLGVPMLTIGSVTLELVNDLGGRAVASKEGEYIRKNARVERTSPLLAGFGVGASFQAWLPATIIIEDTGKDLDVLAETEGGRVVAVAVPGASIFGLNFHAESDNTDRGHEILRNFVHRIAGCSNDWNMGDFMERSVAAIRSRVADDERVICALSGGVDSAVVAALLAKAIGDRLTCIFVDTGLLRKNERQNVETMFRDHFKIDLRVVDAADRFVGRLAGVDEPERKRKIIGEEFIRIFEEMARDVPNAKYLAQGTLYPDVIESVSIRGAGVAVKSHHNVGGLPEDMKFELIEPVRELFKDEVRELGRQLGLPENMVNRHPFPGPGLAVRIIGAVDTARLEALREADDIFIRMLREEDLYRETWQAFVILLPVKAVGFSGEKRTYEWVCSLRAVNSTDGMSAEPTNLPFDFLCRVSERIIKSVARINRVVYDISSKPPATIEWE